MSTVYLCPGFGVGYQGFTTGGLPLNAGLIYTYIAGGTTPQATYTTSGGTVQNANPIVLDADGRTPTEVWLLLGQSYRMDVKDSLGNLIKSYDNITGINDPSTFGEWIPGPVPTYVSATSFTLVGDQTGTFTVGRKVKSTVTAGTVYGEIVAAAFSSVTTVTLKNESGTLDAGLSAVFYGITNPAHPSTAQSTANAQPVCFGRLTLTSGTPVTTADVTAATTVYFTPYKGNAVDVYDGSANWLRFTFSELSIAVPATTSTMYDVFLKNVSGTLTLSAVAWTNDTTRATALTTQNGVYVKTGDTASLYLGSFRTTGSSGQTEDSFAKRYVWNYYNRVIRPMRVVESTGTWNYTTDTYRQANGAAANQLDMVIGVSEDRVIAIVSARAGNTGAAGTANIIAGIGLDSTSANSAQILRNGVNLVTGVPQPAEAEYRGFPGVGRHTLVWLERSTAAGTTTWAGTNGTATIIQMGISGELPG